MADENEGEGNKTAARRYNEAASRTAHKGALPDAEPRSDEERAAMEEAEQRGRQRAKEADPAVIRDYSKPAK
jgi:hypothetical protein